MKQLGSNIWKNVFSSIWVRLAVCILLLGIVHRLFSWNFVHFSTPLGSNTEDLLQNYYDQEGCNLFVGEWVPDPDGPAYTNSTCSLIESPQNCMKNGRPDQGYLHWRWNPRNCSLPKLDPKKFLSIMRDKSLALIGDSLMLNHVQSLLCVLSQVDQAVLVYHDEAYKNRRWSFPLHNLSVSVVWSPLLTKAFTFEDEDGVSSHIIELYLDEPDPVWTQQYEKFDYMIIAGGKWFLKAAIYHENNTISGCHNCYDKNITEVEIEEAYHKALNTILKFITESKHKPYIFFRTSIPDHFENGDMDSGGYCNRTRPYKEGEVELGYMDEILRRVEVEEFVKAAAMAPENGVRLKLLDTTELSLLRPDGHPGAYRHFHPYEGKDKNATIQNDCLHWCVPGPIDYWNDVIMEMLIQHVSNHPSRQQM